MMAASRGNQNMLSLLLQHAADVNLQNTLGCTALMCASFQPSLALSEECVQALLEKGADAYQIEVQSDDFALLMASQSGHAECVWI